MNGSASSSGGVIVLASHSVARQRLLAAACVRAWTDPVDLDESTTKSAFRSERKSAKDRALALAEAKAELIARRRPDTWVIGADQLLECGDAWFDKPRDPVDARVQLMLPLPAFPRRVRAVPE